MVAAKWCLFNFGLNELTLWCSLVIIRWIYMSSFWSDVSDVRDIQNKKQLSFPSDAYIHNKFLCFPYPLRVTRNIQSCQDDSDLPLTFGMIFCLISCGRHSVYGSCVFLVYKNRLIIHRNVNVILLKFSSPTYTEVQCFKMTNAI